MRWMKSLFGDGRRLRKMEAGRSADLVGAGYDCECAGDPVGAERLYRRAVEHSPEDPEALYFLGRIAVWDKRYDEAVGLFERVVELDGQDATYLFELGNALRMAGRNEEALEIFSACLRLLPRCIAAKINHAVASIELNRREEARIELEELRRLRPDIVEIHFNLGGIYREYGKIQESIEAYRKIQDLEPDDPRTHSNLLMMLHYSFVHDARTIFEEHRRFGEIFSGRYVAPRPDRNWPRRLRIGYISPDFRSHVVMHFFEQILARHDRARFEVFCYYTHPEADSVTDRLRRHADHWRDREHASDDELAERIRADRIDILVDLAGHTAGGTGLTVLAKKPAPVQVTYLGYPNTTGLPAVDYRITDAYADPPGESDQLSTERLMRLPASYFCYRPAPTTPEVDELPAAKTGAITFGCFNNFHKISDVFLDIVARVLLAVPGSRFMLKGRPLSVPAVAMTVRKHFEQLGIAAERVELRAWEERFKDHLAIYGEVDIALDSFPYNGATTTCEALWMGVPVVTVVGDRHAARMGSSLLNAVGLGELVASDLDGYVAICARLAADRSRLAELRRTLRERMRRSPLMDEPSFLATIERRYLEMWEEKILRGAVTPAFLPNDPKKHSLERAQAFRKAGKLSEAEAVCEEILLRRPDDAQALALLWELGFDAGRPGVATDWLVRAIEAKDDAAEFHYMLGCVLQAQEKIRDAIECFQRALALDPGLAKAHNNLGCVLERIGDLAGAVECFRSACNANPNLVAALYNLGNACKGLGDRPQAIRHISSALEIEPRHADWLCNLGELQYAEEQLDDALVSFRAALEIDPNYTLALSNLGVVFARIGALDDAITSFERALELKPRDPVAHSWLLWLRHARGGNDVETHAREHRDWSRRYAQEVVRRTGTRRERNAKRRLNVAYLVPDVRWFPVTSLLLPVLASHDQNSFSVTCYASSPAGYVAASRLREACGRWQDLSGTNDHDAAHRIRADRIDILVDLAGHAPGGRALMLAHKPSTVQVSWMGYPGTTDLDAMDYRLTDAVVDAPGEADRLHAEKLVCLPGPSLCYAPLRPCPEVTEPPSSLSGRFSFGCLQPPTVITPEMVALWSELLRGMPHSRLLLRSDGFSAGSVRHTLLQQFGKHGIVPDRLLLLAGVEGSFESLQQYRNIDVALDTFPCNGTSTTCDALWMGVPVVTLAGNSHASRIGASILSAAGQGDLIGTSPQEYVRIASRLAADAHGLRLRRSELRSLLEASPLLDATGFTQRLEAAYLEMWAA